MAPWRQAQAAEIEDGVCDELARPMVGGLPAAERRMVLCCSFSLVCRIVAVLGFCGGRIGERQY